MALNSLPTRVYAQAIRKDLNKKMILMGGPRQVGKTTFATSFIQNYKDGHPAYLNWDNDLQRRAILNSEWPKAEPLIVLDEIHKKKGWQTLIKGIWDTWKNTQRFLVSGSARLDVYRKGGDSMLGRYHYFRIHPYSLPELGINSENQNRLFRFGGFPEPLLAQDETELRRWHLQRASKLVRIDLRDLEHVTNVDKIEILADTLPSRVGSALSYSSLAEDLNASDKTVKRWIQMLDTLYYCYTLSPLGSPKIKAIKKTQKLYLWDWSQIIEPAQRFENFVASHLLKYCDYIEDTQGHRMELRYIRDETGKECDFVVVKDRKPEFAVEAKLTEGPISPSLLALRKKLNIPRWFQVHKQGTAERLVAPDLSIISFQSLCQKIPLI